MIAAKDVKANTSPHSNPNTGIPQDMAHPTLKY